MTVVGDAGGRGAAAFPKSGLPPHPVHAFAADVVEDRIPANQYVRLAAERHLGDLERADLVFDAAAADHGLTFFRHLRVPAGPKAGEPWEPLPWQTFTVGSLMGWLNPDGTRRFRRAYIETPKGSGKSPLGAGLGLYGIFADGEPKAEGYVVARTADQGKPLFRAAVAMVRSTPALEKRCSIRGGLEAEYQIVLPDGSFLWRASSDRQAKGRSGPNPHVVLVDELHEHDSDAMLNVMELGSKQRPQPLTLILTNAGESLETACGRERNRAIGILEGRHTGDSIFALIYCVDDGDDPWESEECWPKAHPSLSIGLPGLPYLRNQVDQARSLPSKRALIDRLLWGRWGGGTGSWIDAESWKAIEVDPGSVPDAVLAAAPQRMALDLSLRRDLTAAAQLWELPDGRLHGRVTCWIPGEGLQERSLMDDVPWTEWAKQPWLTAVDGPLIDYDLLAQWVVQQHNRWPRLAGCAYDPAKIDRLRASLERENVAVTSDPKALGMLMGRIVLFPHPQSFVGGLKIDDDDDKPRLWMPRSIEDLEAAVVDKVLTVERSPLLRWAALGASVRADESKNRRWVKSKSRVLIDPIVALSMAVGLSRSLADEPGGLPMYDGYGQREKKAETPYWLRPL